MNRELLFILNQFYRRMRTNVYPRKQLCYSVWKVNDDCKSIICKNCMLNGIVKYPSKITLEKLSNEPRITTNTLEP